MAEFTLQDIYAKDIVDQAVIDESIRKSAVWNSGLVATDPSLNGLVGSGEGRKISRVGYTDLADPSTLGNAGQAGVHNPGYTDDSDTLLVPNKAGQYSYDNVKCVPAYALGEKEIVRTCNFLPDPTAALGGRISDYWARFFDMYAINMLKGIYLDNKANDSADMTYGDGSTAIDAAAILNAHATLGDAAEMGKGVLIVHSKVAFVLRNAQLIDTIPSAENSAVLFEYFQGMRMIVSDNVPTDTNVTEKCLSIIAQPGIMEFGASYNNIIPSEMWRDPREGVGGGESMVISRQQFSMGCTGFSWQDDTVTGSAASGAIGGSGGTLLWPSIADQAVATNWDRVLDRKKCKLAFIWTSEDA